MLSVEAWSPGTGHAGEESGTFKLQISLIMTGSCTRDIYLSLGCAEGPSAAFQKGASVNAHPHPTPSTLPSLQGANLGDLYSPLSFPTLGSSSCPFPCGFQDLHFQRRR